MELAGNREAVVSDASLIGDVPAAMMLEDFIVQTHSTLLSVKMKAVEPLLLFTVAGFAYKGYNFKHIHIGKGSMHINGYSLVVRKIV